VVAVPLAVVTLTAACPTVPAGEVAVMEVAELTVKVVAAFAPKLTAVAPVKPVPVMVMEVPPATGPVLGAIDVMVGAAVTHLKVPALTVLPDP
jgi:hypothetical protein